jgi:hypothetical protein
MMGRGGRYLTFGKQGMFYDSYDKEPTKFGRSRDWGGPLSLSKDCNLQRT